MNVIVRKWSPFQESWEQCWPSFLYIRHCHRDYSDILRSQIIKFLCLISSKLLSWGLFYRHVQHLQNQTNEYTWQSLVSSSFFKPSVYWFILNELRSVTELTIPLWSIRETGHLWRWQFPKELRKLYSTSRVWREVWSFWLGEKSSTITTVGCLRTYTAIQQLWKADWNYPTNIKRFTFVIFLSVVVPKVRLYYTPGALTLRREKSSLALVLVQHQYWRTGLTHASGIITHLYLRVISAQLYSP